jgi:PAS domain S-box-containing protein
MSTILFEKYSKDDKVNILIVTENKEDIAFVHKEIKALKKEFVLREPDNKNNFASELNNFKPNIIISDLFDKGTTTEKILDLSVNRRFPVPLIILTSGNNKTEALEFVKKGAWDYIIRESSERLGQTIIRALEWKQLRTKLQFAEQDLNEYEKYIQQYRLWEAHVPAIAYHFVVHPDGRQSFRYVSSASKRLLNLDPEDIVSDSSILMKQIHPEDLPGLQKAIQKAIIESAANLKPFKYQLRRLANGIVSWYDINSHPYKEPSGNIVWNGIILDITEKKLAEESLSKEHSFVK